MLGSAVLLNACSRWPEDVSIWRLDMPLAQANQAGANQARANQAEANHIATCYASLSMAERQRADRYRAAAERVRFIVTRATLRFLLSVQTNVSATALRFVAVGNGRPALADFPRLSFNVSHAGHHALIAMSHQRVVGVDIEHVDRQTEWQSLVRMVCSGNQINQLFLTNDREQFYKCWTAKEAILKALGLGLTDDLGRIDFDLDSVGVQRPRIAPPSAATAPFAATAAISVTTTTFQTPSLQGADTLSFHWLTEMDDYMGCIAYSNPLMHAAA